MSRILCIDERAGGSRILEGALSRIGHNPIRASSLEEALGTIRRQPIDLVISDLRLQERDSLVETLRREGSDVPVIVLTPDAEIPADLHLPEGVDFLEKPLRFEALREAIDNALDSAGLPQEGAGATTRGVPAIVGESLALRSVLETIKTVAPTNATVLIEGDSGTGKELLVRALHDHSKRARQAFVAVNCAALPEGLIESTLFGHERGAFTGAHSRFIGAFERAGGGTLLLDEISELRLDLQAKLLRAIQEKQFERVGGSKPIRVDVRVVATSNRDLKKEVESGRFRADLFYRLRVVPIHVPSLHRRPDDIPVLVRHFARRTAADLDRTPPEIPDSTMENLRNRRWPGNVRELEHAVERAVILNRTGRLLPDDFPEDEEPVLPARNEGGSGSHEPPVETEFNLKVLERRTIERALQATGGHRLRAAGLLGISDRTLRNKLNPRRAA